MSALASPLAGDPLSTPFTGVGGGDPFGGITSFGFSIPQGSPGELEAAARSCAAGGLGLTMQGQGIGQGTRVALGEWQGEAQTAFAAYAMEAGSVMGANAGAFTKAGGALDHLAGELSRAQTITRQAASDSETYQQQLTAAEQAYSQHSQDAQNLSQQAALAAHPHMQTQLNQQANAAADQAQAAQGRATSARHQLELARQRGRDAASAYQEQADAVGVQIKAASAEITTVFRVPGGAPVPINATPADINLAKRILLGAGSLQNAAKAARDPGLLRRLAGGGVSPAAASVFLHALKVDEEDAAKPEQGSIIDAVGGVFHIGSFGLINFGNPNTENYKDGEIAAMIPIDPDSWVVDGDKIAAKIAEDGEKEAADRGITQIIKTRPEPGADAGISNHIVEQDNGDTISVTHQVNRDGEVVHQHQTYVGKYGGQRQFPNEWSQFPDINAP